MRKPFATRLAPVCLLATLVLLPARQAMPADAPSYEELRKAVEERQRPPGHVRLAHGAPPCGEGHYYFVREARLDIREMDWAQGTLAAIYLSDERMNHAMTEYRVDIKLSRAEMEALFSSPDYLAWLTPEGEKVMRALLAAREAHIAKAAESDAYFKRVGNVALYYRLPEVAEYRRARRAARAYLVNKLGLVVKSDQTVC